ncbi:response regulator transcription factor [soil metagenome]
MNPETSTAETSINSTQAEQRSRLLLIDDDQKFCRLISDYLSRYGYEVSAVHDGNAGLELSVGHGFDAIILDVMLPGLDGYAVLRKLREQTQIPVLMLTALGDETDRIVGLEIGADDYLPKTFSPRELLARLRAVLRRTKAAEQSTKTEIILGSLTIDLLARRANLGDELLALTPVEFDLLVVLAQAKGRVQTREHLLNEIRERNYDIFDRTIDVHISALRRKLQDDPKNPRFIRTVRAAGYMLIDQSDSRS